MSRPGDDFADGAGTVGGKEQPAIGDGDDGARATTVDGNRILVDHFAVRRHAADLVGEVFGEPEVAVWRHGYAPHGSVGGLHWPLGEVPLRVDASHRIGFGLDEPDVAVGMRRHGAGLAVRRRTFLFLDVTVDVDAAGLPSLELAEPQLAASYHQRNRSAAWRQSLRQFRL